MVESYPIECPHCHAKGNLADASLLGQAICCPTCQQVFVAPLPVSAAAAVPVPVVAIPPAPAVTIPAAPVQPVAVAEVPQPTPESAPQAPVAQTPIPQAPSVAEAVAPPATTWKFGAAPEEVLASSVPVVSVSIPSAVAPAVVAPIADAVPVAAVPMPVQPVAAPVAAAPVMPAAPVVAYAPVPVPTVVPGALGQLMAPVAPDQTAPAAAGQFFPQVAGPPPTEHYLPSEPFAGVVLPPVHAMDGPIPSFMAPPPPPGQAEMSFAQSLPEPVARGAVQPPKQISKTNQNLIIGGISAILLFAAVMFLMGDPFRRVGKTKPPEEPAEMNPIAKPYVPQAGDTTAEDAFARINALNNPKPDKK